jgi:hypothetical protein
MSNSLPSPFPKSSVIFAIPVGIHFHHDQHQHADDGYMQQGDEAGHIEVGDQVPDR